jgi:hypothetical protein
MLFPNSDNFILDYLEQKPYNEAAAHLGWMQDSMEDWNEGRKHHRAGLDR